MCCGCDELLSPYAALHLFKFSVKYDKSYFTFWKGDYEFRIDNYHKGVSIDVRNKGTLVCRFSDKQRIEFYLDEGRVVVWAGSDVSTVYL